MQNYYKENPSLSMQMLGNMICRHGEEWLGDIEMMAVLSAFYNWMKRGQDKRFLSQIACFIHWIWKMSCNNLLMLPVVTRRITNK